MLHLLIIFAMVFMTQGANLQAYRGLGDHSRIIGGRDTVQGEIPYICSLRKTENNKHFCGCSILNNKRLLSAAHCLKDREPKDVFVYCGSNSQSGGGGVIYHPSEFVLHKDYVPSILKNDIAMIKLDQEIQFTDRVKVIEVDYGHHDVGTVLTISGWGYMLYPDMVLPDICQVFERPVVSLKDCQDEYGAKRGITDAQICTETIWDEKGICNGDSGGPLVVNGMQVGVVSYGRPCATGAPDVNTRCEMYKDFISEHMT